MDLLSKSSISAHRAERQIVSDCYPVVFLRLAGVAALYKRQPLQIRYM